MIGRRCSAGKRFKPIWRKRRLAIIHRPTREALRRAWCLARWGMLTDPTCPF